MKKSIISESQIVAAIKAQESGKKVADICRETWRMLSWLFLKPCQRKNMVAYVVEHHQISISRACRIASLPKSMYYYQKLKG